MISIPLLLFIIGFLHTSFRKSREYTNQSAGMFLLLLYIFVAIIWCFIGTSTCQSTFGQEYKFNIFQGVSTCVNKQGEIRTFYNF